MALVTPSPPKIKEIRPQANTGGVKAPSGPSVAGQMVKNARGQQRGVKVPKLGKPRPVAIPKAPKGTPKIASTTKNPYNALNSPYRTQGEFNKAVTETAKAGYQPKLSELSTAEEGQKGLSTAREADNVNIYKQYSQQANEAYEKAKSSMTEIASRANASTAAGQQALQAALSNTGVAGLPGVPNQSQFMAEASGLGNMSSQTLAGEQSGIEGEMAKNLLTPGVGLNEAQREEGVREGGVLNKLQSERDKINREIPQDVAKTRTEMMRDEETRQANRLQAQIAEQKLGIEKQAKVEVGQEKNQVARESAKEKNEYAERVKREEIGIKEEAVQNQKKSLEDKVRTAKTKEEQAAAKLQAARYDNGLKIMTSYLKENPKTEYRPGAPNAATALQEGKLEYRRNAEHLYKMLTEQGNMTAPEAFKLMKSSGNGYIEQYADEHERIYNAKSKVPSTRIVTNKRGGQIEVPTYKKPGVK